MLPTIQVLGVRAFHKTESLKRQVEEALQTIGVDLKVELMTDLEDMVETTITAIPAVIIDDHVIIQGEIPSKTEMLEIIRGALHAKIVVPVDFSESSRSALRYAEAIAEAFFLKIKVLHVYGPVSTLPEGVLDGSATDWLDVLHEDMRVFIDPKTPISNARMKNRAVKTEYEIRSGKVEAELRRESKFCDTKLIIMANSGDHDIGNRWFGSTAVKVARQAECPVLLVPPDHTFKGFRRIAVATDKKNVSTFHQKLVTGLCLPQKGLIKYINIQLKKSAFWIMTEQELEADNGVFHEQADKVEDGLLHFAEKMEADMIVLIARHRNGWQELFHRSCTKNLVQKCHIPILVLPPSPEPDQQENTEA